jgi:hypothetical protein
MRAWTKNESRNTKVSFAFALFSLLSLLVVAWSRTDFSSQTLPLPISEGNYRSTLYNSIKTTTESPVITQTDSITTQSNRSSKTATVPATIAPQSQATKPVKESAIKQVLEPVSSIVGTGPIIDTKSQNETQKSHCASVLMLSVCVDLHL